MTGLGNQEFKRSETLNTAKSVSYDESVHMAAGRAGTNACTHSSAVEVRWDESSSLRFLAVYRHARDSSSSILVLVPDHLPASPARVYVG